MRNFPSIFFFLIVAAMIFVSNSGVSQNSRTNNVSSVFDTDDRLKIRLGFTAVNFINRQILLTVDDRASMGYDWGFDALLNDVQTDDLSWLIDEEKYVIQGIDNINIDETYLPLALKKGEDGLVIISIDSLENVPDDLDIYLQDTELNTFHNLRTSDYQISLSSGQYDNRYQIVFQSQSSILSAVEKDLNQISFYYALRKNMIVISNPANIEFKSIEVYNMLGMSCFKNEKKWQESYREYELQNLSTGTYIVKLIAENNKVLTKKIIVN